MKFPKPHFVYHNRSLRCIVPETNILNYDLVNYWAQCYTHLNYNVFKANNGPLFKNHMLRIENSYIHKLYNIPTHNHYIIKYGDNSKFIHMTNTLNNYHGDRHNITCEIFNDNNELYGYINQSIYVYKK